MYIVLDQQNNPIALLENMMILDYNDKSVIGIIIGDCFFGKKNHVIGKIFNDHAYLVTGEIIGSVIKPSTKYTNFFIGIGFFKYFKNSWIIIIGIFDSIINNTMFIGPSARK